MPSYGHSQSRVWRPLRTHTTQRTYQTYISPYGPKTKHVPNVNGLSLGTALRYGAIASGFGVATGIFALFFFDGVPRVKNDILSKIPIIGNHFVKEIAPEDNPF